MTEKEKTPIQWEPKLDFSELFEAVPDAIVVVDEHGHIVRVNERTEKMFGYGRDELLGKAVEILAPDRIRKQHVNHRSGYYYQLTMCLRRFWT